MLLRCGQTDNYPPSDSPLGWRKTYTGPCFFDPTHALHLFRVLLVLFLGLGVSPYPTLSLPSGSPALKEPGRRTLPLLLVQVRSTLDDLHDMHLYPDESPAYPFPKPPLHSDQDAAMDRPLGPDALLDDQRQEKESDCWC